MRNSVPCVRQKEAWVVSQVVNQVKALLPTAAARFLPPLSQKTPFAPAVELPVALGRSAVDNQPRPSTRPGGGLMPTTVRLAALLACATFTGAAHGQQAVTLKGHTDWVGAV